MTKFDILKQKGTDITKEVKQGFSWPCFWFGCFWYWYKGMVGQGFLWGFAALLISLITFGIGGIGLWIILAVFANNQYKEFLLNKGYKKVKTILK